MYNILELRYKNGTRDFKTTNVVNHITGDDNGSFLDIRNCKHRKIHFAQFHVFESEESAWEWVSKQDKRY